MRKRISRREQVADTRRRLLDAARRVFMRRGFHGATLDLVAKEAGLTKGAVYSRFRSKADLLLALLELRIAERIADVETVALDGHGPLAVSTALSRQWDERLQRDEEWSLLLIEFRVHAARVPALNRRYAALHARLRAAMAATIRRESEAVGETLPVPPEDITRVALALGTGAVLERCADGADFPPHLMETANRAIVQGLRTAVEAPATRRLRRIGG